ncbi:hypothetical protein PVAP13_5KG356214 [Panicum virgatum]|uniref:Uncharacterized protein n=1 Tax=Panicum virgatum TaxID=38727 RepID=A0A8T0SN43_PANVG|nr:hypothetical protein PVAP13_5KG356214 [Panicum virgatum]
MFEICHYLPLQYIYKKIDQITLSSSFLLFLHSLSYSSAGLLLLPNRGQGRGLTASSALSTTCAASRRRHPRPSSQLQTTTVRPLLQTTSAVRRRPPNPRQNRAAPPKIVPPRGPPPPAARPPAQLLACFCYCGKTRRPATLFLPLPKFLALPPPPPGLGRRHSARLPPTAAPEDDLLFLRR